MSKFRQPSNPKRGKGFYHDQGLHKFSRSYWADLQLGNLCITTFVIPNVVRNLLNQLHRFLAILEMTVIQKLLSK